MIDIDVIYGKYFFYSLIKMISTEDTRTLEKIFNELKQKTKERTLECFVLV